MYKLVIADDESMIRKGLSYSIEWESLGYELVAAFEDGTDVLEYIKTHPVDVILSDIVMCNIGGLEIAKHIYENRLPIKVVLMSGYQDFKFAHDAIRFQVFDYLLKPIANKEIGEKFRFLKETLDQNVANAETEQNEEDPQIIDCISDMQSVMIKKIWNEQSIDSSIVKLITSAIGFNFINSDNIVIFMCQCSKQSETIKELLRIKEQSLSKNGCFVSLIDDGHILGMFGCDKGFDENKRIRQAITQLSDENHSFFFVKKKKIILNNDEIEPDVSQIVTFVKNAVLYLQSLDKFENALQEVIEPPDNIDDAFKLQLLRLVIEIFCIRLYPVKISDESVGLLFNNITLKGEMRDILKSLYEKMVAIQNGPFNGSYDFAIEKVRKYIKSHLHEDISVNALADMVHLNSAYFGRYFKKATFMTVKQYIYENRMELAIELLAQKRYTVVEIAKMVGYDFKYFFPLFKKYTGYTPKEYLKYFID